MAFSDLIGQKIACQPLQQAIAAGKLAHAYLFSGPPGIGKRCAADALAQTVFCSSPRLVEGLPDGCGQCLSCRKYLAATHPDLHRVDLAADKTQILVEQIREACQFLAMTAMAGRWKVVIIQDARWMNEAAANALLKTLEEPTPETLLILITAYAGSLLPTIRSRCQHLRFADLALEATSDAAAETLRHEFNTALETITSQPLAALIDLAEKWSDKERFPLLISLLRALIHSLVYRVNLEEQPRWIHYEVQLDRAYRDAMRYNLNRQLVVESLLMTYRHLMGAAHDVRR